jgi:hypothetical protein
MRWHFGLARLEDLRERASSFRLETRERHRMAMSLLKQSHERFPFHNPEAIDHLTEEDL